MVTEIVIALALTHEKPQNKIKTKTNHNTLLKTWGVIKRIFNGTKFV